MLLFSTILDTTERLTVDEFIRLVIAWNQDSVYANNVIPDIDWQGAHQARYGAEGRWLQFIEDESEGIIAARYEKTDENGVIWDSDYVFNSRTMKMAIRLDRSYTDESLLARPDFSTPHFITYLIEGGYLAEDGELPILRTPSTLSDDDLYWLAEVILGNKRYRLPIVYVSRTYDNELPVDTARMASRLKGVAHVFVEESVFQNKPLRERCDSQNEYHGAIGIYFPNPNIPHRKYLYRANGGFDEVLMEKVIRTVISYSNAQQVDTLYSWQGVRNAILNNHLKHQQEKHSNTERALKAEQAELFDDYVSEVADLELQLEELQAQIIELTNANESLRYENQGLRHKMDSFDAIPLLYMGSEYDLYPGEIKDLLLTILADAQKNFVKDSRRLHVVTDLLTHNQSTGTTKDNALAVKALFKNYNGMTAKLRQSLQAMGFDITEEGKHYKLTFCGDHRYQVIIAKTPSDNRAGKNDAAFIINKVF